MTKPLPTHNELLGSIHTLLVDGRKQVATAVNNAMVQTYWHIGRLIVEDVQQGESAQNMANKYLKAFLCR